jgi:hypothetical protein
MKIVLSNQGQEMTIMRQQMELMLQMMKKMAI